MNLFLVACAGLVLLSAVFVLLPRKRGNEREAVQKANVEWLRLRERELAADGDEAGAAQLADDARLRLLEDDGAGYAAATTATGRFPAWLLLPLLAVFCAVLYYHLGAAADVTLFRDMQSIGDNPTEAERAALIGAMEARAQQRPDNLNYQALLGRYYMSRADYPQAANTYNRLAEAAPEDAQALAYAAQAEYLAADRTLSDRARLRAEQALAVDPHQRTALGLLGMASFEQGRYRAAIEYWERLLAVEMPGSQSAAMISSVIGRAREMLGAGTAQTAQAPQAPQGESGTGITVEVSLPQGAAVEPGATVFVLARPAATGSRMPIAVQRFNSPSFPLMVRLDDSNSMAGQKLSEAGQVVVAVQVSADGRPGAANASWLAESEPVAPGSGAQPLQLQLRPGGA